MGWRVDFCWFKDMLHPSFSWVEEVETHLGSLLFEIAFLPQVQKAFHWGFWLPGVSGLGLTDRQPSKDGTPAFDWLGVSFGLTAPLFRFWSRAGYRPVVMSNTPNDQTGEMSIKMLLPVSVAWRKVMVWSPGKFGCGLSSGFDIFEWKHWTFLLGPPIVRQLLSERFLPLRPSLAHPSTVDLPPAFAPWAFGDGLF